MDVPIRIYRIAEAFPDGTFELIDPYASYPVNIHGVTAQEQWNSIADTLSAYIVSDKVAPYREERTNEDGVVGFTQLETGLYLVDEAMAENNSGTYLFHRFMVYLPTPQGDGSFDYAVEAKPKCTNYVPKTEYRVTKLWQDSGHEANRPKEITVDIYKDAVLQETQILSAENNWSYHWYVSGEDHGKWTVVERTTPKGYTVTLRQNEGSFSIINTYKTDPETPDRPQTGDTSNFPLYILIMCLSGIALIILSRWGKRRDV